MEYFAINTEWCASSIHKVILAKMQIYKKKQMKLLYSKWICYIFW